MSERMYREWSQCERAEDGRIVSGEERRRMREREMLGVKRKWRRGREEGRLR